jgi:hypothetical protein
MTLDLINAIVVSIGIPSLIGVCIFVGIKLNVLSSVDKDVEKIKHNVKVISDYLTKNNKRFNPQELRAHSLYYLEAHSEITK